MLKLVRPLFILSAAMLILAACTRERPTPEPTATTAVVSNAPATAVNQAQIVTNTGETGSEVGIVVTNTPNALTPSAVLTPTRATPETFLYTVRAGDTLGIIATRFETDVETLREMNNLRSDDLAVGQPLYVPYREGMTAEGAPTPTPGPFLYTVQAGDTLSGLGVRFGVNPIAITEANRDTLLDPNNLTVGTTILIPGYQPPAATTGEEGSEEGTPGTAAEGESVVHTVQAGQGLIQIATLYGVSVAEIAAANGMSEQDMIRVGQQLIIPGVTKRDIAIAQGNVHTVQPGESLLSIALLYGVTVEELQAANELDNPDSIFIGQELIIPVE
ncbi:MAG: LysM peptidoglycan-binding domain-containing protein [Caldilineaceae bacterium]|nr:LysM peptidoglycan-binding domain-containing protein [Caldilineaceae bacterium]